MSTTPAQGSSTPRRLSTDDRRAGARQVSMRSAPYGRHIAGVLVAAFTLSAVHTVYAWVEGIGDPTFTVTTPLAWAFYVAGFGSAALASRTGKVAQVSLLAYLVVLLGISILYYPTTFGPEQQTTFGWIENDVYVGLLVTAAYLVVQRLRQATLTPA